MSGILPSGGVAPQSTVNSVLDPLLSAGCAALFFKLTCNPKFDPAWGNAVISEFLNFMKRVGHSYDCSSLDNLADSMDKFICSLPTFTAAQVGTAPDYIAGCFNGSNGKILLSELAILINPSLCLLPVNGAPDLDDTIAGCFDGVEGQTTISSIISLIPATSLCALPLQVTPDLDDTLAGCFDGVQGRTTIQSVLDLNRGSDILAVGPAYAFTAYTPSVGFPGVRLQGVINKNQLSNPLIITVNGVNLGTGGGTNGGGGGLETHTVEVVAVNNFAYYRKFITGQNVVPPYENLPTWKFLANAPANLITFVIDPPVETPTINLLQTITLL